MAVLDQKLRRDFWAAKGTLLAITSIITIGVMCFVSMRSLYWDLRGAKDDYYAQCRMADFWVDLKKAPLADIGRAAEIPGVASIRSRIAFYATVDIPSARKPLNGLVLSLPNEPARVINGVVMRRGGYFTTERDDEVIVHDAFARARGLAPGDVIHLLLNNRRQTLHIVGTAISSEFAYLVSPGTIMPDNEHFGVFYIKRRFAEDVFDMQGAANQIVGMLTPTARSAPSAVLDRVDRRLASAGVVSTIARKNQTSNLFLVSEIEGLGVFATVLPAVFLAVAALVLNVLMSRLTDQQRMVIGTLKALGYTDAQVFVYFLKFGLSVGVVGGLLGCGLGYASAVGMAQLYQQYFEFPELPARLHPPAYLVGMAISVGCALLGSLHGARAALRLQPAESMRAKPPASGRRVWIERAPFIWPRLSFAWRMALRNVFRNRLRTGVGMFAAATGAALLVVGLLMLESTSFLIDFQYKKIMRSDIDLTLESTRSAAVLSDARALPSVDYVEPQFHLPCTLRHGWRSRKTGIAGLVPRPRLTVPRDAEGRPMRIPETGLLLSSKMAELLDVRVGDRIVVEPSRGARRPVEAPVVAIAESYLDAVVYADIAYVSSLVDEALAINALQLLTSRDPAAEDALYRKLKETPALAGVNARADVMRGIEDALLESQNLAIGMFVLFAGTVFFGSVLNASLVSLAERQREVATLQVLGYGPWQIGGLLFRESVVVSMAGAVLGLPLGWFLYVAMAEWYETELIRLPVVTSPWVWFVALVVALCFTVLAQVIVQRRIFQMDWLESLQVME